MHGLSTAGAVGTGRGERRLHSSLRADEGQLYISSPRQMHGTLCVTWDSMASP